MLGNWKVLNTPALRENGIEPTFVTGLLQDADGKRVTSLMDGEKLAIQADNRSQTVQSIAERATGLTLDAAGDTLNENRNGGLRIGRQTENSPDAEAGGGDGRRTEIPSEERQRFSGQRAGEQAGGLGQGTEKGQPVFGQVRKASSRRSYAEAHGKVTVYNRGSGKSLGIRAAAESSKSQIASEQQVQQDEELRDISEAFKQATGLPVSFTFGTVKLANGREARGVYTGKRFVVQCDDDTYTASQLAMHELYHYFADKNPGLNAKLKERILKANKGQALDEVMQTYINELGPAAGLSENMSKKAYDKAIDKILEEVFADAYAGINDYGARASQFNEEARQTERDFRSSENAAATAQRTGPPKQKSTASLKKDLRDKLLSTFHTPDGYKQYLGNMVGEYADRILEKGSLTDEETTALFDALYEEGSVKTAADEVFQEARKEVRGAKIYVPESIKHEFSDDWRAFQRRAFGQGVLLTNNPADMAIDEYHAAISAEYPGVFDPDETDMRTILETIVNVADSGKGKTVSLRDYGTSLEAYLQDGWAYDSREEQQAELRRAMEEALQEFADQAGRDKFSIAEIRGEKEDYGKAVILDTNIFNGISPRNWGKVLGDFVYNHLAGTKAVMYDENGNPESIEFARKNDRVKKDGANNSHRVLDKLARHNGDNIKALATVQLSELLKVSGNETSTSEHSHQWMDENGWTLRTAYVVDRDGSIYEATLNIANGRDRRILYAISNVRKIDEIATGGDVPSTDTGGARSTSHSDPDDTVAETTPDVKTLEAEINAEGLLLTSKENNKNNQRIRAWIKEHYPALVGRVRFVNDKATGRVTVERIDGQNEAERIANAEREAAAHRQMNDEINARYGLTHENSQRESGLIRSFEDRDAVISALENALAGMPDVESAEVKGSRGMGSYETLYIQAELENGEPVEYRLSNHESRYGGADRYFWNGKYENVEQLIKDVESAIREDAGMGGGTSFSLSEDTDRFSLKGQTGAEQTAAQEARTLGSREVLDTPALKKLGVKVSGSVGDYGKTESLIAKDRAARSSARPARTWIGSIPRTVSRRSKPHHVKGAPDFRRSWFFWPVFSGKMASELLSLLVEQQKQGSGGEAHGAAQEQGGAAEDLQHRSGQHGGDGDQALGQDAEDAGNLAQLVLVHDAHQGRTDGDIDEGEKEAQQEAAQAEQEQKAVQGAAPGHQQPIADGEGDHDPCHAAEAEGYLAPAFVLLGFGAEDHTADQGTEADEHAENGSPQLRREEFVK